MRFPLKIAYCIKQNADGKSTLSGFAEVSNTKKNLQR